MPSVPRQQSRSKLWDGNSEGLTALGYGVSGIVFAIDDRKVVKIHNGTPKSMSDMETERTAYRKISEKQCPYLLKCLEPSNTHGLVLERCCGTLRGRLRKGPQPEVEVVVKWAWQAAQGLACIHSCNIIQVDGKEIFV
jgi:hypothetical protein